MALLPIATLASALSIPTLTLSIPAMLLVGPPVIRMGRSMLGLRRRREPFFNGGRKKLSDEVIEI